MFIPNLYNERGKFYMFIFFVHSYIFLVPYSCFLKLEAYIFFVLEAKVVCLLYCTIVGVFD